MAVAQDRKPIDFADSWQLVSNAQVSMSLRYRPQHSGKPEHADIDSPLVGFWREARQWDATMRVRNRWMPDEGLRDRVASRSREQFAAWKIDESLLAKIARSGRIEVLSDIPKPRRRPSGLAGLLNIAALTEGLVGWVASQAVANEVRRMPWESLLVMAARKYQNHERLLVYRRFAGLEGHKEHFVREGAKALFVATAPGILWNVYDFTYEEQAMRAYLDGVKVESGKNLSLAELKELIAANKFAVIHVSGLDGVQGFQVLQDQAQPSGSAEPGAADGSSTATPARAAQGIYFRDEKGQPRVESPAAVADALCAGKEKPLLVTFNVFNSSAQLAAQTVRQGAAAAIGFQDYLDDTVSEIFFANLFRAWSHRKDTPLLEAIERAVRTGAVHRSHSRVGCSAVDERTPAG
jgi:hypothetical protein